MKVPISDFACIDLDAPTIATREIRDEETGSVRWVIWCQYCREWHYHGAGEGHREGHCSEPGSPHSVTGYSVALCHLNFFLSRLASVRPFRPICLKCEIMSWRMLCSSWPLVRVACRMIRTPSELPPFSANPTPT